MLKWEFDSLGQWQAESSQIDEDGFAYEWRISVCDDGTFTVVDSDSELTTRRETFSTLQTAKAFCESSEAVATVIG